jgi:hypothetical protein
LIILIDKMFRMINDVETIIFCAQEERYLYFAPFIRFSKRSSSDYGLAITRFGIKVMWFWSFGGASII